MELKLNELVIPEKITFNYEELKAELTDKVKTYEAIVYDDAQIKEAKADRANLNKLKKALNDERIRLEREYNKPFSVFKEQINEIIGIIDKPVEIIDKQVKAYEDKAKEEKRAEILDAFNDIAFPAYVTLDMIFDDKWLNASVNMKQVREALIARNDKIMADLDTLKALPAFEFEAIEIYKETLDINRAIAEGKRLADIQRRKAESENVPERETTVEPTPAPQEVAEVNQVTDAQWVKFAALLTIPQAQLLKIFFNEHKIEFKAI